MSAEVEHEVYDQPAFDAAVASGVLRRRNCDCCGNRVKYVCVVAHTDGTAFAIGRDCAAKIDALKRDPRLAGLDDASKRVAERMLCNSRETDFRRANPDAVAALDWAKTGVNKVATDLAEKLRRYGLSDAQVALLKSLHERWVAEHAAATGSAVAGRQTVRGTVVSVKLIATEPKSRWDAGGYCAKVLVKLATGVKLYGNAPGALVHGGGIVAGSCDVVVGQEVEFKATVEPSEKDNLFGFWKRPADWKTVSGGAQ